MNNNNKYKKSAHLPYLLIYLKELFRRKKSLTDLYLTIMRSDRIGVGMKVNGAYSLEQAKELAISLANEFYKTNFNNFQQIRKFEISSKEPFTVDIIHVSKFNDNITVEKIE